jgi:hypothetical protein
LIYVKARAHGKAPTCAAWHFWSWQPFLSGRDGPFQLASLYGFNGNCEFPDGENQNLAL